ncbi:unnamed protein product [Pleuronectes platessa]|uniref:Uncharacterized protein n=1 Tax=Pleuronectes platessa TaxID=8262 RepID=A0A9N7YPW2_PLEPL|nr:unnamed protein product [Pleuronectes platessa]
MPTTRRTEVRGIITWIKPRTRGPEFVYSSPGISSTSTYWKTIPGLFSYCVLRPCRISSRAQEPGFLQDQSSLFNRCSRRVVSDGNQFVIHPDQADNHGTVYFTMDQADNLRPGTSLLSPGSADNLGQSIITRIKPTNLGPVC